MDVFAERFSCRKYDMRPIEREKLENILDAALLAPSACNRQPWTFLVVEDDTPRKAIYEAYPREWILTAPAYIIALGHHESAWHRPSDGKDHTDIDVAIAVEHICLAASAHGLGTCWVCNFDSEFIRHAFNIPDGVEPIAIIPIGYPAEGVEAPEKIRKPLNEVVKWNRL